MKLQGLFVAFVYRKKEPTPYKLDNGQEGLSYRIIIDDFVSTAEVKVTEEVYNSLNEMELCLLGYEYDTEPPRNVNRRNEIKVNKLYGVMHTTDKLKCDDIARFCMAGFNAENKKAKAN